MAWEGFDIETSGEEDAFALQPWRVKDRQAWIRTWATAGPASQPIDGVIAPDSFDETRRLLRELVTRWCDEKTVVCAWNATFEASWLCAYGLEPLVRHVRWLDGMLLWQHLEMTPEYDISADKRRGWGLKAAVAKFLPQFAGYDEGVDFHGDDVLNLLHYNGCDSLFTREITRRLYCQLRDERPKQLRAAKLEAANITLLGNANYEGVEIDEGGLEKLDQALIEQADDALSKLEPHGATPAILGSPAQLSKLLFEDWGLQPISYSQKTDKPSTDKHTLHELSLIDDRVEEIKRFREAKLNRTKFVANIRKAIRYNNDGRAHPLARIFGTYSGRLTYASAQGKGKAKAQVGWAIHQMKRAPEYRSLVKAPPGHVLVEFDAGGQEYRWMAILSGDPVMQRLCLPGEDPHAYMGASAGQKDYKWVVEWKDDDKGAKNVRQLGKVGNLSLQYRTSAKKLLSVARTDFKMDMQLPAAQNLHRTYPQTYREVPRYWKRQIQFVKRAGYVETVAGRQVTVPLKLMRTHEWSVESTSINYPIQGTGADQKHLAMVALQSLIYSMGARFLFDLHDGLYFVVPEENKSEFIRRGLHLLDNLPYEKAWDFTPPIPLPWDAKVGTSWGNMKEVKTNDQGELVIP